MLTEKLKVAQETARRASIHADESSDEEEAPETEEQKAKRLDFERRRKAHYNEASAIKLARKLINQEIEAELDENEEGEGSGMAADESIDEETLDDDIDKDASSATLPFA